MKSKVEGTYLLFRDAIEKIANSEKYYDIHHKMDNSEQFDIADFYFIFEINDEEEFGNAVFSLTKGEIEAILYNLPKLLVKFNENRITPLFKLRYRKYMFRILYLLWQDNYGKTRFRNLFLYVLNLPESGFYVEEIKFSAETLISIVKDEDIETRFAGLARSEKVSMREFLDLHKIRKDSIIAIEVLSIFYLFCSSKDYIDIGSERLIIALMNAEMKNQAKILINMVKNLSVEDRLILNDVFQYFYYKYYYTGRKINDEFWNLVPSDIFKTVQEEFWNIPL